MKRIRSYKKSMVYWTVILMTSVILISEAQAGVLGTTVNVIGQVLAFPFELTGGIFRTVF